LRQTELSEAAIVTIISDRIEQGHYPVGTRLPSESALAAELGVSRWFVRRAYNRLTTDGVIERKDFHRPVVPIGDGFKFKLPEFSPLRTTQRIAAILPSHPVCSGGLAIVAGISRALKELGSDYRAEIFDNSFQTSHDDMLASERNALESIRSSRDVDGLIWWLCSDDDVVAEFRHACPDLPIVFIDRLPSGPRVDFVGIDDVETAQEAVVQLIQLGHKRIAHVVESGEYSTIRDRARGYCNALSASGIGIDPNLIVKLEWTRVSSAGAFDKLWSLRERPTAIFATNDFVAYSLIDEAEARGIAVPEELSVMGHGNLDQFGQRKYLSTVDQPYEMTGRKATRLLVSRLGASAQPTPSAQHLILHAPVIMRKSCCPPSRRSPDIVRIST